MEHKEGAQEGEAEGKAKAQGKKRKEREVQKGRCRLLATATGCNKGDACKYDHPTDLRCPQCKSFKTIKEFSRAQLLKWKAKPVCKECLQETEDALLQQQQSAEEPSENKKRTRRKKKMKAEDEGPVTEKAEGDGDNGEDEKDEGKQASALLGRCKFLGSPQGCPNPKECQYRHPASEPCGRCGVSKPIAEFSRAQLKSKTNPLCKSCLASQT